MVGGFKCLGRPGPYSPFLFSFPLHRLWRTPGVLLTKAELVTVLRRVEVVGIMQSDVLKASTGIKGSTVEA